MTTPTRERGVRAGAVHDERPTKMTKLIRFCAWLSRVTPYIVLTPHVRAVGNRAEEIYFGLLKARRDGKKLIILSPFELPGRLRWPLTNMEITRIESPYRAKLPGAVEFAARLLLTSYFLFFRLFGFVRRKLTGRIPEALTLFPGIGTFSLWEPREAMREFSWDIVDEMQWREQIEIPLPVSVAREKAEDASARLASLGLPEDAWFACLHVREGGFLKDQSIERNADIMNYLGAIEEVTSRGGWVVRMGDASMRRLPQMDRVIDYPFTSAKSELMDVYIISRCRLYIGMSSGIYEIAILFQRPIILTNMWSWLFPFPQKRGDLSLLKHLYSKSNGRYLSLREWLEEPFASHFFYTVGENYTFHENDSDELREVVRESFNRGAGWQPTSLQTEFNELRFRNSRRLLSETEAVIQRPDWFADIHQRYRLASRVDSSLGMLSAEFLRRNWVTDVRNAS